MKKKSFWKKVIFMILCLAFCSCETTDNQTENTTIHKLIKEGRNDDVKSLFKTKGDINSIDKNGNTALHIAAEKDNADIIHFLCSKGASVNQKNKDGNTALVIAVRNGSKNAIKALVSENADIYAYSSDSRTALEEALSKGNDTASAFISEKSSYQIDENGNSLLHNFVIHRNLECVKAYIKEKLSLSMKNNSQMTPLSIALSQYENEESIFIAAELIENGSPFEKGEFAYFENAIKLRNPSLRIDGGQTPLHIATIKGHTGILKYLLSKKTDVNSKDSSGATALHEAVRYGRLSEAKLLLSKGADPNIKDSLGKSCLLLLIPVQNRISIYDILISGGANVNDKDMYGDTPFHIATIGDMSAEILQKLKNAGSDINERNKEGLSPLSLAISKGKLSHVRFYVENGADIYAENTEGVTPLELAINSSLDVFKSCINEKNINLRDSYGNTVLHIAAKENPSDDIIEYILSLNPEINSRNSSGESGLFLAVKNGKKHLGELLLAKGADIYAVNNKGQSPLKLALGNNSSSKSWFITRNIISKTDGNGNTPLHYAAEWDNPSSIKLLLDRGANPNLQNQNGETALFIAIKTDNSNIAELLIKQNADKNCRDNLGNTPLHACVQWSAVKCAEVLIRNNADMNAKNLAGKTPLSESCRIGKISLATLLIEEKANPDETDFTGKTALVEAIENGNKTIVNLLLKKKASPLIKDMYGRTAFHEAADSGNIDIIKALRNAGCSPLVKDSNGITPFSLSLKHSEAVMKEVLGTNTQIADSDGNTPVHIAINEKASEDVLKFLIGRKFPINTRNSLGQTPLLIAVQRKENRQIELLLKEGANPFIQDNNGDSALTKAFEDDSIATIFASLIGNMQDDKGDTILHYAAKSADEETMQKILSHNINRQIKNIEGETAYDVAVRWERYSIADMLK